MPFKIVRDNIVNMKVDAIVNTANPNPVIGYGVDTIIHQTAGIQLLEERKQIGKIQVGDVQPTKAYQLKAKYVFHAVGPKWIDGNHKEVEDLTSCYEKSLHLATQLKCKSIAFPFISTGYYGFPKELALQIASKCIQNYLNEYELDVYLVVFDKTSYQLSKKLRCDVQSYIDDHYVEQKYASRKRREIKDTILYNRAEVYEECAFMQSSKVEAPRSLSDALKHIESTFSESLNDWIIRKDYLETEVYKRANIDRKLFSKIRNNKDYQPKKKTAIALAIGLRLNLDETKDFIGKAGFALSKSNMFDVIIEYFILNEIYDIYKINEVLFDYDQPLIGV